MIRTIMKCPICGKKFSTKYREGGYIDHVNNWVGNYNFYKLNNINVLIDDLTTDNLNYREEKDIIERKECFIKWLRKQKENENIIKEIEEKTIERLEYIAIINKDIEIIKKIISKYENYKDIEHIKSKISAIS